MLGSRDSKWILLFGRQTKFEWWLQSGSHSKSKNQLGKFRKCGELLLENGFPQRMKGKVYHCCRD